jgi:hypothetical protein
VSTLAQGVRLSGAARRRALAGSVVVACALLGAPSLLSSARTADNPSSEATDLERVTSRFEVKYADGVLRQLSRLFSSGFVRRDADLVAREIQALPADQTRLWVFNAARKGVTYPLQLRARLDQTGTLELDFFTQPPLAAQVREALDRYRKARGW